MMPLDIIGRLEVPDQVLRHRFVLEALGAATVLADNDDPNHRVVGTLETKTCELYGWGANVPPHRDNTGWTYLVMLNEGISYVHCRLKALATGNGPSAVIRAVQGDVIRLHDCHEHWTEDAAPRVAAFVGSWPSPDDSAALPILEAGIKALATGDYYGAPRVREGFQALQPDECYAANEYVTEYSPMLRTDAVARGFHVLHCAKCDEPACRIDSHWPYFWDGNRCAKHLHGGAS